MRTLPITPRSTPAALLLGLVALQTLSTGEVAAQSPAAPLAAGTSAGAPATPTPSAQPPEEGDDPLRTFRAPLLREGSTLVEAHARLKRDPNTNWWTIVVEPTGWSAEAPYSSPEQTIADGGAALTSGRLVSPPHELILLPCTRLTEMERIIEATPGGDVRFQVSGRAYVFRDRNYFLPTHAAVISETAPPHLTTAHPAATSAPASPIAATMPASQAAVEPAASSPANPSAVNDDSAEAIARALAQETGPLARSSGAARVRASAERQVNAAAGPDTQPQRTADRSTPMQENTVIVNRRGKVIRDRSGGWVLVFDADSSGLADPPLRLLPCMLLESIEDYARRVGNNSPVIMTGQVLTYNGQTHLLPTVYRIPRERSRINS